MNDETKKVYICNILKDDEGLSKLQKLLEDNGMQVLFHSSSSDDVAGANLSETTEAKSIDSQIAQCSIMVVYISSEVEDCNRVNLEIEYGHRKGKRIIGVWEFGGSGCKVPDALRKISDAIVDWHDKRILDAINGEINITLNPDGTPCAQPDFDRYDCAKNST